MSLLINESAITKAIDAGNNKLKADQSNNGMFPLFTDAMYNKNTAKDANGNPISDEKSIIQKYRQYAQIAKVNEAVRNIINEMIVPEEDESIKIITDKIKTEDKKLDKLMKDSVEIIFESIKNKLQFHIRGEDYVERFYVDGRLFVYFEFNKKNGISELRILDPLKLYILNDHNNKPYYEYDTGESDESGRKKDKIQLPFNRVIFIESGISDEKGTVLSYLHKAIRPINLLQMMENSLVIYRFVRAPERWVFKIDVGGLSRAKAEEYMRDMKNNFRQQFAMDAISGEVQTQNTVMSMQENFWFAKTRAQNQGHEIETVGGNMCLDMNTKVKLLDGRDLSIKEIEIELNKEKELWTYSCHPKTGEVVPGKISWAGVTQKSASVMKITLDNGENIICTPEHKFPIYHKGFIQAKDLKENDSLIPLYTKKETMYDNVKYDMFFDNYEKKWKWTHRFVAKYFRDILVFNEDFNELDEKKYNTIHHKNFNRFNNSPDNLCYMDNKDHFSLHNEFAIDLVEFMKEFTKDEVKYNTWKSKISKGLKDHYEDIENRNRQKQNMLDFYQKNPDRKEWFKQHLAMVWDDIVNDDEKYKKYCSSVSKGLIEYYNNITVEEYEKMCLRNKEKAILGGEKYAELMSSNAKFRDNKINSIINYWSCDENRKRRSLEQTEYNNDMWKKHGDELRKNHRYTQKIEISNNIIKAIIDIVNNKTTHQLTVTDVKDILNNNENILKEFISLNSHKKVPNCNIYDGFTENIIKKCVKDYGYENWIDFRKKESLHNHRITKIEYLDDNIEVGTLSIDTDEEYHNYHTFALSCGVFTKNSNLGEIDDILYFQKEMYKSLNVPISRLEPESTFNFGSNNDEITRDELMFYRFIKYVRRRFNKLFLELIEIELVTKGICSKEQFYNIKEDLRFRYVNDSIYESAKKKSILNSRLEVVSSHEELLLKYYGKDYIRKNILEQTDEEIKEYDKDIEKNSPKEEEQDKDRY